MKSIFDNTKLLNMNMKNRIFRGALWEGLADEKGHMTKELSDIYEELAKGGVGTIITGYAFVTENEQPNPGMLGIYNDSFIDEYKEFTDMIHKHGANIIMQIAYGGFMTRFNVGERTIWGPSTMQDEVNKTWAKEMTKEDIKTLIKAHADAALRVKKAGFDGVEIHCAHGYLLSQFLSPYFNKRTDEYGGNLENRLRLANEIIQEVRRSVGEDYIVAIRFGAYDYWEGGSKLEEIPIAVRSFIDSGADLIDISGGLCRFQNPYSKEPGYFKEISKIAKETSSVPVILTGGVKKAKDAENLLKEGYCDLIGVGRAMIMDAEWSKKALKSLENMQ